MSENWTVNNIPDLTGKVIIVTGANSGIGLEAAREFARKGATTILACRNMDKARAALKSILAEIPQARAEIMQLDLASLNSIRSFADEFKSRYDRLDVLVNNAGIMMVPYRQTEDGFEAQFGTNHLGHFALTGLLIDLLEKTPGSRVVNISSGGHRMGNMDFNNLLYRGGKGYSRISAYGRSKLANLLFTYELERRLERNGSNPIAVAAHPGLADTHLADHFAGGHLKRFSHIYMKYLAQSASMGALPGIRAAVDPQVRGGQYYGPGGPRERSGYPIVVESNQASHNEADAEHLWQKSEELTGVSYL
ncbi:MAG: short-chain dehydrogenase [Anaerolineales bacterium]|nr:SDR family NAD(P)-dependent oxidoreductase [Anaerolineae bacterium]PWB50180.1 MAG: short-chain dehydrogenase [Anaerolineales bacterium]